MTDKQPLPGRDSRNRFVKGNPGKPPGSPDIKPRSRGYNDKTSVETRRTISGSVAVLAQSAKENLPEVLAFLATEAKTNPRAAEAYIRAVSPGAPKTAYAPELAHMRPEERIPAISALVALGKLDLEAALALSRMAEAEIRWAVITPIRQCLDRLDRANQKGDQAEVRTALVQLAERVRELSGTVIEGEKEVGNG